MTELPRPGTGWMDLGELLGPATVPDESLAADPETARTVDVVVALYDAHQRDLYGFLRSALDEPDQADDFVQEAFLRLVREIGAGRLPANPGGWLYRVCANLIVSDARRRGVSARRRFSAWRSEAANSAEEESLRREARDELAQRLRRLPTEARLALLMAAQGLSGREIAAALGRTETATRTILCRARRRLRDEVSRDEGSRSGPAGRTRRRP